MYVFVCYKSTTRTTHAFKGLNLLTINNLTMQINSSKWTTKMNKFGKWSEKYRKFKIFHFPSFSFFKRL